MIDKVKPSLAEKKPPFIFPTPWMKRSSFHRPKNKGRPMAFPENEIFRLH